MIYISGIKVLPAAQSTHAEVVREALEHARKLAALSEGDPFEIFISRENIDARRGKPLSFVYRIGYRCLKTEDDENKLYTALVRKISGRKNMTLEKTKDRTSFEEYLKNTAPTGSKKPAVRPVVAGFGPAGMFLALMLARSGVRPIVVERGKKAPDRAQDIETFCRTGKLDPNSNVQFGEGGAGTFSDGKLATGIKDPEGIGRFVLKELVRFGAPGEILFESKPHVGTDKLCTVVQNLRREVESLGGELWFETRLTDFETDDSDRICAVSVERDGQAEKLSTNACFLALGHSSRDTYEWLLKKNVRMERKPFAMGFRIEHSQKWLNEKQYREYADYASLGAADYKLAVTTSENRGVYTFCMCPGGVVMPAASEEGGVCTNGMSYYARAEENANSAVLVTLNPQDFEKTDDFGGSVLAGMYLQRKLEQRAFRLGGETYRAPAETVNDYLKQKKPAGFGCVEPSYARGGIGVTPGDLNQLYPEYMNRAFHEGLGLLGESLAGFDQPDAVLTGVEARSSSPLRLRRDDKTLESNFGGLYPVGEGAGYAGGIMSAAIDGIRCARAYLDSLRG